MKISSKSKGKGPLLIKRKILEFEEIPEPKKDGHVIIHARHFLPYPPGDVKRLWVITDPEYTVDLQPTHNTNCVLEDRVHEWDFWVPFGLKDVYGIRYFGMALGKKNVRLLAEFK